jgi:hypothetical protein
MWTRLHSMFGVFSDVWGTSACLRQQVRLMAQKYSRALYFISQYPLILKKTGIMAYTGNTLTNLPFLLLRQKQISGARTTDSFASNSPTWVPSCLVVFFYLWSGSWIRGLEFDPCLTHSHSLIRGYPRPPPDQRLSPNWAVNARLQPLQNKLPQQQQLCTSFCRHWPMSNDVRKEYSPLGFNTGRETSPRSLPFASISARPFNSPTPLTSATQIALRTQYTTLQKIELYVRWRYSDQAMGCSAWGTDRSVCY